MYIWMSLQAKCYRCGCTATIYIWMVAGGIQIQTGHVIENFLFRIFETCFQSFYKVFVFLEDFFQDFVNFYFCPLAPVIHVLSTTCWSRGNDIIFESPVNNKSREIEQMMDSTHQKQEQICGPKTRLQNHSHLFNIRKFPYIVQETTI